MEKRGKTKMKCENKLCKKETGMAFKLKSGFYVCSNCATLAGITI